MTEVPDAEQPGVAQIGTENAATECGVCGPPRSFRPLRAKPGKKLCRTSCSKADLAKDALHGASQVMVVAIDGSWVLPAMAGQGFLSGGEERLDGFVAENKQGGDGAQPGWNGLVAASRANPADDLFAAQLLQVVSGVAGTVGGWV